MKNPRYISRVRLAGEVDHLLARLSAQPVDLGALIERIEVGAEDRRPYQNVDLRRDEQGLGKMGVPAAPGETSVRLPVAHRAGHPSGFLERLLEEFFQGMPYNTTGKPKLVTEAQFGTQTKENTLTWGQTVDLTIPGGITTVSLAQVGIRQTVQVSRFQPTSHTILSQVALGPGWTGNAAETITILFTYILGVGTTKVSVQRSLTSGAGPFNGQIITDVFQAPMQSVAGTAAIQAVTLGAETTALAINATSLVAPVVQ